MLRAPDGGDLEETAAVTFTVTGSETAVATRSSLAKTSGTASACTTASTAAMVEAVDSTRCTERLRKKIREDGDW